MTNKPLFDMNNPADRVLAAKCATHAFYLQRMARRMEASQGVTGASIELYRLARERTPEEQAAAFDRQMARDGGAAYKRMGLAV